MGGAKHFLRILCSENGEMFADLGGTPEFMPRCPVLGLYWVAIKELNIGYYIPETTLILYLYKPLWQFRLSSLAATQFRAVIATAMLSSNKASSRAWCFFAGAVATLNPKP